MAHLNTNSHKQRRGKKEGGAILFSCTVLAVNQDETLEQGLPLRLCFVRNRNKPDDFIVIASTDLELSPEMTVRVYSRRWKIETNFQNQKSYLGLGSETISTSFDNQNAFANISCLRATILEFNSHDTEGNTIDISRRNPLMRQLNPIHDAVLIGNYSDSHWVLGW